MKQLITLIIKCCLLAATFTLAPAAMSADYEPRLLGKTGCYQASKKGEGKRLSNARFCHNCLNSGGNQVQWHFQVFCEGKPTAKIFRVPRQCSRKHIPDEGEQSREIYEAAEEFMEENLQTLAGWRDCNLGGWK